MAFVRPSLVVDTTNTSGTGSYALVNGDPGDGFRNLADAVTDGDAANSDTISYFIVDTTTKGATLAWEHGTGTISDSGATLARTSIIESSNGDAAVNWGVGGTRTIRFGAGTAGFALLAAAQTFTAVQTLSASGAALSLTGASDPSVRIAEAGSATSYTDLADVTADQGDLRKVVATGNAFLDVQAIPSDGAGSANVRIFRDVNTSGTRQVQIFAGDGTGTVIHTLSATGAAFTGTVTVGGTAVALQGVLSAPSGFRMIAGTSTIPSGWVLYTTSVDDRAVILTDTGSEVGDVAGSWTVSGLDVSGSTDAHTLTVAQMPAHTHTVTVYNADSFGGAVNIRGTDFSTSMGTEPTSSAGSGDSHTHGLTGAGVSSTGAWRPLYRKFIVIEKS